MLNLSSTEDQLFRELCEDSKHVNYWHRKYYGGKRGYDKWQDEQLAKVKDKKSGYEIIGDLIDYHSMTSGNRWKSFEVTTSYGQGNSFTRNFKFCYFDTYGSVGAFMYMTQKNGKDVVLIFPSHFFLRYADRMGIKHRDAALVCEFYVRNHAMPMKLSDEPDENGIRQLVIASTEGVCYGIAKTKIDTPDDMYNQHNIYEVRTFLKYEQLNNKQKKEADMLKEAFEPYRDIAGLPDIHTIGMMESDKKFGDKMIEITKKQLGITDEQFCMIQEIIHIVAYTTGYYKKLYNNLKQMMNNSSIPMQTQFIHDATVYAAEMVKEKGSDMNNADIARIVHKLKGDDYDWSKWLWMFAGYMRELPSMTDKHKAYLKYLKDLSVKEKLTFERMVELIN